MAQLLSTPTLGPKEEFYEPELWIPAVQLTNNELLDYTTRLVACDKYPWHNNVPCFLSSVFLCLSFWIALLI